MPEAFDLITMGRSGIDFYSNDIGAPFVEIESFAVYVGGCPTNIAVGTRRLGLRTTLLTAVGEDLVGDFILKFLADEGVKTKFIETSLWQLNGHSFGANDPLLGMARYLVKLAVLANAERYRELPAIFHTDHIKGPQTLSILKAGIRGIPVQIGETSAVVSPATISLDSSELGEAENIAYICELCQAAREARREVTLEMEAGVDAGVTPLEDARRLPGGVMDNGVQTYVSEQYVPRVVERVRILGGEDAAPACMKRIRSMEE